MLSLSDGALRVNINGDKLNTPERRKKAILVADEMRTVINHPSFEKRLREIDFHGERSLWKDRTIDQIIEHIRSGAEVLDPVVDFEIDLYVDDYYTPTRTVGMTYPSDKYIYCNTKYFDSNSSRLVGSNFLHEWGHKLGFEHDYKSTYARNFSICYQLNDVYEAVWNEVYGSPSVNDLVQVCYRPWWKFGLKHCYWVHSSAAPLAL